MSQDSNDNSDNKYTRRDFVRGAGVSAAALAGSGCLQGDQAAQGQAEDSVQWDLEADVVVIGSGAAGMPAAIRARDGGASVLVVECNYDIGGHGILNGGTVHLGGGTAMQKKYGVNDTPDDYFKDLTDWTVVESNGLADYRYNDRGLHRAMADNMPATFDFLVENGVPFEDMPPGTSGGHAVGISFPRGHEVTWDKGQSAESPRGGGGTAIYRSLEVSARDKGIRFLLNYHMDSIYREQPHAGRVLGIKASYHPRYLPGESAPMKSFHSKGNVDMTQPSVNVKARRAVIIATGGSTGNVEFRRIFDPRLTEEFQLAGDPYSPQDASGEMAAMAIGASLWGTANQSNERNGFFRKRDLIGSQYLYIEWTPDSIMFPFVRATGLKVGDWNDLILVNQVGQRFYNELAGNWPYGTGYGDLLPYNRGDWRNTRRIDYTPHDYLDAACAPNEGSQPPDYGSGPTWAIFDAAAVEREGWDVSPPHTDPKYFFSADSLEELARKVKGNPYQKVDMPADYLVETVRRWNEIVDMGEDPDFERPDPAYKIDKPPFYAAWATPVVHDTYAGLRVNMKCQVMDMKGQVITGLYCSGESVGGCSQHGQGRCLTQGYIAGGEAAKESGWES